MSHEFILSQSDGRPMYLQIIDQIKLLISVDEWRPGYKLPSIRELAVAAKVSVITVKRAYQDLENAGIIVTQQGKGSFVADVGDIGAQLKAQELEEHLLKALDTARSMGLSDTELIERLAELTSAIDDEDTNT